LSVDGGRRRAPLVAPLPRARTLRSWHVGTALWRCAAAAAAPAGAAARTGGGGGGSGGGGARRRRRAALVGAGAAQAIYLGRGQGGTSARARGHAAQPGDLAATQLPRGANWSAHSTGAPAAARHALICKSGQPVSKLQAQRALASSSAAHACGRCLGDACPRLPPQQLQQRQRRATAAKPYISAAYRVIKGLVAAHSGLPPLTVNGDWLNLQDFDFSWKQPAGAARAKTPHLSYRARQPGSRREYTTAAPKRQTSAGRVRRRRRKPVARPWDRRTRPAGAAHAGQVPRRAPGRAARSPPLNAAVRDRAKEPIKRVHEPQSAQTGGGSPPEPGRGRGLWRFLLSE
jgi:hypothetical protein